MIGDLDSRDYAENESRLQAVYGRLQALAHERRVVSGAEELEALEREIRVETDRLASVLLERQVNIAAKAAPTEVVGSAAAPTGEVADDRARFRRTSPATSGDR